ncbi:DUF86 domain-containing protein [soil metagenome]
MPRNTLLFLKDMRVAAQKIKRYTQSSTFESYRQDEQMIDATLHNLEIIGEAAKNIPQDTRSSYPDIPWRNMARFRDVIAHHYFGINLETVWDIVENELPNLLSELDTVIADEETKEV